MIKFMKRIYCTITFGHEMVWTHPEKEGVDGEDMCCSKCGFQWNSWNNVGGL